MKYRYFGIILFCLALLVSSCASSNIKAANKAARKRYKGFNNNCHCQIELIQTPVNQKNS